MFNIHFTNDKIADIKNYSRYWNDPFEQNMSYVLLHLEVNKMIVKDFVDVTYINSGYSRYDSSSIYYFQLPDNRIIEIWKSDDEKNDEFLLHFLTCVKISQKSINDNILYHYHLVFPNKNEAIELIVHSGLIGHGSKGNSNYRIIEEYCNKIIKDQSSEKIIIDLTDTEYESGDWMLMIIDGFNTDKKYSIIVGEKCRRGISTLIKWDLNTKYDCVDNGNGFFLNINDAIDYLVE